MKRVLFLISLVCVVAVSCNDKSQSTPYLKLSENDLELWFDESEHSVVVESSDEWSATSNNEWITVKTVSGKAGEENLVFAVSQNNTDAMRNGSITLQSSHPDLSRILTIKQYDASAGGMSISYTTIDKKPVSVYNPEAFDGEIVSNEYQNGIGTITFSRTVTAIGAEAFYGNETLETVTLPHSVARIDDWAFSSCVYITDINIPERVKTIGSSAFAYCVRIQEISLPDSVEDIGASAFSGCSGLTSFKGKFASKDNRCLVVDNVLVKFAPKGVKSYAIEDGIVGIGADAFYESVSLRDITIPASVKSIGDYAFYYCENLGKVYCKATTPPTLGSNVFDNFDNGVDRPIGCTIYVPQKSVDTYKETVKWIKYSQYITGYDF
uniref:leucine-rich repeat protein n=1 Tax=Alistipes sp. TaxID=1872444 RepID=UPI004057524A